MSKLINAVVVWNDRRKEKKRKAAISQSNKEIADLQCDYSGYVTY